MLPTHYNTIAVEEEESSCPCVEYEVPRELLQQRDQLIPPLEIKFKRFEENIWIMQQFCSQKNRSGKNCTVVLDD